MTLDNMLQECARDTYNSKVMQRTGGAYTGKGLEYAIRFLSGINEAMRKICREKYAPSAQQTVTLSSGSVFNLSVLTNTCLQIRSIKQEDTTFGFMQDEMGDVWLDIRIEGDVQVIYSYLPSDMTLNDLDVEFRLPTHIVDPSVVCQYADYKFLSQEGTDYDTARAQVWLGLFNDSFANIVRPATQRQVKVVR